MLQVDHILQDRYQIERQLGNNGIRQTWLAKDLQAADEKNSLVVVKLLAFGGGVQWDDLKLFEREAQILKQLNHDRIPQYIDYFCIDDRNLWFGLVQEYIPGKSLKEKLVDGNRFSEKQTLKIANQILKILIYLHDLNPGVLHRDIKPSNLIWGEDNQIYLVDFGAVQDKAAKEGVTFTVVGTYGYAPIEQFGGRAIPASDLYALGATLIHLLTGLAPADLPQKDLRLQFVDRVNISPSFASWLQKLTEPSPEQRFSDARQALDALKSGQIVKSAPKNQVLEEEFINNSGCGVFNSSEAVPEEILGWNWGAFLMPWFWIWPNYVWLYGLVSFIPYLGWIMAIALGANGNTWAWKSRRWRSIKQFKEHQRGWAIAGMMIGVPMSILFWGSAIVILKSMLGI
ncbi:serine/threonine protein kinase [Anabaena cylindrica FACHB-243]|uniref:Serine/threonine protein kinase n=1 Tax=Anabaena cylindrica (strain ATCC 27899 / PCC 7122) TaxID=272123 RepID=K9ZH74_ANACC|nr:MULTISPECIES: serine/threonine-protein kinase [Anabaena]AFZ58541.1 serine/threonine protein kinase [Anabaena cylindrica PCC 7122]MBD2416304.1 serine/threonine protein kinase [Anabaena cylindrica FACHB-243]MBY5283293.1 serine/threonine protein kinase [Anabaena sp. CCAP 1446/1C]MBY5311321.1 serine/threonine protein kinase [Anabaena sp. CCAP 1446/1C]MCM2407315.1 serine/threonine protein kinase [Anabaena sp. CCAP 1446/1C]